MSNCHFINHPQFSAPFIEHGDWTEQDRIRGYAAVGILFLLPEVCGDPTRIVLTRRATHVSSHRDQICLPGGRVDQEDRDPRVTARRETCEELGLPLKDVKTLGSFEPFVSLSGSLVYPVYMRTLVKEHDFAPNPTEVAEIFTLPWTSFIMERSESIEFNLFGVLRTTKVFRVRGLNIWGLTAKILYQAGLY